MPSPLEPTTSSLHSEQRNAFLQHNGSNVPQQQQLVQMPSLKRRQDDESEHAPTQPPAIRLQGLSQHRVCVTCRRRKVKCDKKQPCQHCVKTGIECVFPSKRSSGERQAAADAELLHELRRLEPMFKSLVSKINDDGLPNNLQTTSNLQEIVQGLQAAPAPTTQPPTSSIPANISKHSAMRPVVRELARVQGSPSTNHSLCGAEIIPWSAYGTSLGKLVKDSGRNRYISGLFWDALHTEDTGTISDSGSEASDPGDFESPTSVESNNDLEYLNHNQVAKNDRGPLHPSPERRMRAWQLFKENVHPLVPLLHIPTVEQLTTEGMKSLDSRPFLPHVEPLMLVVYYGAITSLSYEATIREFGEEHATLLKRYRIALQASLARARLLETDDLLVLQAFVVFLTILRRHDPSLSWNLTGLAVRLAQSQGMHRDGSILKLSIFDAEMRRRLWWHICLLDTASSEDHSCTPTTLEISSFDAAPPLNLDDSLLTPDMTELPPENRGVTDVTFAHVRCRFTDFWRTIIDKRRSASPDGKSFAAMTTMEKENWVSQNVRQLQGEFITTTPSSEPFHWVILTIVKLLSCNLRLFVYNPLEHNNMLTDEEKAAAFSTAIECLEHSHALRTNPRTAKWTWLLSCYHEWFAMAVVLSELCDNPLREHTDRAWRILEQSVVLRWNSALNHRKSHQWRSIINTLDRARAERKKELRRRRAPSSSFPASSVPQVSSSDASLHMTIPQFESIQAAQLPSETFLMGPQGTGSLVGGLGASSDSAPTYLSLLHYGELDRDSHHIGILSGMDLDHGVLDERDFDTFEHNPRFENYSYQANG